MRDLQLKYRTKRDDEQVRHRKFISLFVQLTATHIVVGN
jgi:hypothetical protein